MIIELSYNPKTEKCLLIFCLDDGRKIPVKITSKDLNEAIRFQIGLYSLKMKRIDK